MSVCDDIEKECQLLLRYVKHLDQEGIGDEDFKTLLTHSIKSSAQLVQLSEEVAEVKGLDEKIVQETGNLAVALREKVVVFLKSKKEAKWDPHNQVILQICVKSRQEVLGAIKNVFQNSKRIASLIDEAPSDEEPQNEDPNPPKNEPQALPEDPEFVKKIEEKKEDLNSRNALLSKILSQAKSFLLALNEVQNVVVSKNKELFKQVLRQTIQELDVLRGLCEEVTSYSGWEDLKEGTKQCLNIAAMCLRGNDENLEQSFSVKREKLAEKIVAIVSKIRNLILQRIQDIKQEIEDLYLEREEQQQQQQHQLQPQHQHQQQQEEQQHEKQQEEQQQQQKQEEQQQQQKSEETTQHNIVIHFQQEPDIPAPQEGTEAVPGATPSHETSIPDTASKSAIEDFLGEETPKKPTISLTPPTDNNRSSEEQLHMLLDTDPVKRKKENRKSSNPSLSATNSTPNERRRHSRGVVPMIRGTSQPVLNSNTHIGLSNLAAGLNQEEEEVPAVRRKRDSASEHHDGDKSKPVTKKISTNTRKPRATPQSTLAPLSEDPKQTPMKQPLNDIFSALESPYEKVLDILFKRFPAWREDWEKLEEQKKRAIGKSIEEVFQNDDLALLSSKPRSMIPTTSSGNLPKTPSKDDLGSDAMSDLQRLILTETMNESNRKKLPVDGKFSFRVAKKPDRKKLDRRSSSLLIDLTTMESESPFPIQNIKEQSLSLINFVYQLFITCDNIYHQRDELSKEKLTIQPPKSANSASAPESLKYDHLLKQMKDKLKLVNISIKEILLILIKDTESLENLTESLPPNTVGSLLKYNDELTLDCEKSLSTELDNEFTSGRWVRFVQQNILIAIYQNITSFFFLICQLLPELKPSEEQSMTCTLHVLTLINSIHKIFRSLLVNVDNINNLEKIVERKGKESAPEDIQKILKGSKNSSMDNTDKETESEQLLEKPDSPGDLDNLILRLTPSLSHTPNHDFTNAFLTTCHRFSSPYDVLERLFDRFNVLTKRQEKMKGKTKDPKRQHEDDVGMAGVRVVNTIVKWLKANTHFVDENIANLLRLFVDKNLRKVQLFESPIRLMDNELMNTHQYDFPSTLSRKPPDAIVAFIGDYDPYEIILQVDELVIAQQLTLIEWEIYVKIREVELLNQSWSKEKRQPIAQNVVQLMQRANRTSFWVATSILLQSRAKDRTKAVTKFMNIAKHLKDLNNYNTLMAIIAGLNTVSVSRLKQTFASVKKNVLEQWEILMEVMNPSNSFKKLRTALEEAGQTALPYIGLYLSDLTFMEDGNPDYITSEDGTKLINYAKHFMIYKAIDSFKKFQTISKYGSQFQKTDHFKFLFHLPVFDETDLYQLSLLREPRENQ